MSKKEDVMDELTKARKSRNQMHRRAQLAEAKLKATYKLLEAEGAYHLEAPVVVQKDGDIVRLLSTINMEKFWAGVERGKGMYHMGPLRTIAVYVARRLSRLSGWIRELAS